MNKGGGLEGVRGGFVGHLGGGQATKLVVNERKELVGRGRIALVDLLEDEGEVTFVQSSGSVAGE